MDHSKVISKRPLPSPQSATSSGYRKRRARLRELPQLSCIGLPQSPAPPMLWKSPFRFSIDPLQVSSDMGGYQTKMMTPITHHWEDQVEGAQPGWTSASLPYGIGSTFTDMCQTSVSSYSVYTNRWNNQDQCNSAREAISNSAHGSPEQKAKDPRDMYIEAILSHLAQLKDRLARILMCKIEASVQEMVDDIQELCDIGLLVQHGGVSEKV